MIKARKDIVTLTQQYIAQLEPGQQDLSLSMLVKLAKALRGKFSEEGHQES